MKPLQILMVGPVLTQNGGMATLEKLILKYAPSDFDVRFIASHDEGTHIYRIAVFTSCLCRYVFALLFRQVDVVYVHVSDHGSLLRKYIVAWIGFLFRKPVVMHTHGGGFPETQKRLPRLMNYALNRMFRGCSALIALSETWKDFYANSCTVRPERIHVLKNPVELLATSVARENRDRADVKILYCGRIRYLKGTFDLIRAFSLLPADVQKNTELILAGDGEVDVAQALVDALQLHDRIKLLGWVDGVVREELMNDADIFTLPSHHEGLPMAILEAMSAGLPIVSTHVGGIPEIVNDGRNGYLIEAGDIEQLSDRLRRLIEHRQLRIDLGRQARADCEPYDISVYWTTLAGIFRQSIKRTD